MPQPKTIWTVGHSTRPVEDFLELLRSFGIDCLVDIRHYPGSKKYPQYNRSALEVSLAGAGIRYVHMVSLGGRRRPRPDSSNTAWRSEGFRGYADYMETDAFRTAVSQLEELAEAAPTAYMCAEAVWWQCHRSLVSDFLKARGWQVMHIMNAGKAEEHPWTKPARLEGGKLVYRNEDSGKTLFPDE